VVWIGQEPYPRQEDACGRSFAVPEGRPVPPSLLNLERELDEDLGASIDDFTLQHWAEQGFLMLNVHLTTSEGHPHGHLEWPAVTGRIVQQLAARREGLVFVALGKHAQRFVRKWVGEFAPHHTLVFAPHPSPATAGKGFFGSKIFSRITDALAKEGHRMLWSAYDWRTYNGKGDLGI
jgi:uracil-DNA glycosylase